MNQTNNRIREEWVRDINIIITPIEDESCSHRDIVIFKEKLFRIIDELLKSQEHKLREGLVEKIKEDLHIHSKKAVNTENKQDLDEEIGVCKYIGILLSNLSPNKENE